MVWLYLVAYGLLLLALLGAFPVLAFIVAKAWRDSHPRREVIPESVPYTVAAAVVIALVLIACVALLILNPVILA